MAKKKEKVNKITDEQLQAVQQQQRDLNQSLNALGVLEMQRQAVIDAVHKCQKDIESTNTNEYDNINDGYKEFNSLKTLLKLYYELKYEEAIKPGGQLYKEAKEDFENNQNSKIIKPLLHLTST